MDKSTTRLDELVEKVGRRLDPPLKLKAVREQQTPPPRPPGGAAEQQMAPLSVLQI